MVFKKILFGVICLAMFVAAGILVGGIRAKYRSLPDVKTVAALRYAGLIEDYSLLQYLEASPERGKSALIKYVDVIRKIQSDKIRFNQNQLHFRLGLAYLRLYRVELAENKPDEAAAYMASAQKELLSAGYKGDTSAQNLGKIIGAREAWDRKHYDNEQTASAASEAEGKPQITELHR